MDLTDDQKLEIQELRSAEYLTRRATVPALEEILYEPVSVLDHGFVRTIDYMGDDAAVVQAARVSYGKGTKKVLDQLASQSTQNHQGRGDVLDGAEANEVLQILKEDSIRNYDHYVEMLNEDPDGNKIDEDRNGLARELARMNLTLNAYTQWYWKIDLHNLLHFLSLRADAHAQYEIRVYADAMLETVKRWVPITYNAFQQYRVGGINLSASALSVVKKLLAGDQITQEDSGMSKREWRELMTTLDHK